MAFYAKNICTRHAIVCHKTTSLNPILPNIEIYLDCKVLYSYLFTPYIYIEFDLLSLHIVSIVTYYMAVLKETI